MKHIPICLQLFSVREELAKDFEGTLAAVKAMGYDGVEFFGAYEKDPSYYKKAASNAGLLIAGWHTQYAAVAPDRLNDTIAFNKALCNEFVVVPALPKDLCRSIADWEAVADRFNEISAVLRQNGLRLGYHNHAVEFAKIDGVTPWYAFFDRADKEIIMQLDTGNAMSGGANVEQVLARYPGRSWSIHIKPFKYGVPNGMETIMGEDSQPYETIKAHCENGVTQFYIIEYECKTLYSEFDGARLCLDALKAKGF